MLPAPPALSFFRPSRGMRHCFARCSTRRASRRQGGGGARVRFVRSTVPLPRSHATLDRVSSPRLPSMAGSQALSPELQPDRPILLADARGAAQVCIPPHLHASPHTSMHLPSSPHITSHLPAPPHTSPHLHASPLITPHLPTSPRITPHLPTPPTRHLPPHRISLVDTYARCSLLLAPCTLVDTCLALLPPGAWTPSFFRAGRRSFCTTPTPFSDGARGTGGGRSSISGSICFTGRRVTESPTASPSYFL